MASISSSSCVPLLVETTLTAEFLFSTETSNIDPTPNTTSETYECTWGKDDIEALGRSSNGGSKRLKYHECSFKVQLLMLVTCVASLSFLVRGLLSCDTRPDAGVRLSNRGQAVQPIVEEASLSHNKSSPSVLEVFQVYQPVVLPSGPADQAIRSDGSLNTTATVLAATHLGCTQLLMKYSFGFSYGHPFVSNYTPPSCQFNRVVMNFTVTSRGRQFDRLALMYFGDTEVWRTSTAEPTIDGIRWTYMKDMSEYLYFWDQPQKLIFDLGNLIDSTYTGYFNTTLTASFFTTPDSGDAAPLIIPISARRSASDAASLFILPGDTAVNSIDFPQNANRAVFSVSACGQAAEEFWWSNVLQSNINTFMPNDGVLPGFSPWREVQIYIDEQLAGVEWPFPIVFTGGVAPGLWRPIVGIDAFDLREHEIDITPWLPILCDGNKHTFEIRVAGVNDSGGTTGTLTQTVGNSWYVTGKIFVWLDASSSVTTGTRPTVVVPAPYIKLSQSYTQNSAGLNQTLSYSTFVTRSLSISSIVRTQKGTAAETWTQALSYSNLGLFTDQGNSQTNNFTTFGYDVSTGLHSYSSSYYYPLYANTTVFVDPSGNFSISADFSHGLSFETYGDSIFPSGLESLSSNSGTNNDPSSYSGSYLRTVQNGTAYYFSSPSTGSGISFGSTEQDFSFGAANPGLSTELYRRDVVAINGTVVKDKETLATAVIEDYVGPEPLMMSMGPQGALVSPKQAVGRGPGQSKPALAQGEV